MAGHVHRTFESSKPCEIMKTSGSMYAFREAERGYWAVLVRAWSFAVQCYTSI